jgi:alpha-tubulin suppressor-like RCC1 family protein
VPAKAAAGGYHTVEILEDGTLWGWGYNGSGQLGDGTTTNRTSPTQIGSATNWSSVAAGDYHTIGIMSDGTLWGWGYNLYGQLGDGTTTDRTSPTQIASSTNWSRVRAGEFHTVGIKSDDTLWAWGGGMGIARLEMELLRIKQTQSYYPLMPKKH